MEIRESRDGEAIVFAPDGSLSGAEEANALETRLGATIRAGGRQIVIDCSGVAQLTSLAIRVLLQASRKLARAQGRLVLFGMNAKVKKAFAISGFDKDLDVAPSRDDALRLVRAPAAAPPPPRPAPPAVSDTPARAVSEVLPPAAAPPVAKPPAAAPTAAPPAAAPTSTAAPAEPVTVHDRRHDIVNALLGALGVRVVLPGASAAADAALEPAADALLGVLRASQG
jgi:anti-sigma B factor antagonist